MPNQLPQLFVNGKKTSSFRALGVPSENQMFAFESLRSYGGRVFRFEEHLDRLFESAKTCGLEVSKSREELKREVFFILRNFSHADIFVRLTVDDRASYILVLERKRPSWIYEKGIDLKTSVVRRNSVNSLPPEPKTNAFLNNVLGFMEKEDHGIYDALFLDSRGYITEASVWNIFVVKEERLFTPETGILHGVTREFVIECAQKESLPVIETNLTRHDIWNAEEAFLTNTSGEIAPVRSLDGRLIGEKIPGVMTKRLMARFRKELEKELKS